MKKYYKLDNGKLKECKEEEKEFEYEFDEKMHPDLRVEDLVLKDKELHDAREHRRGIE